jgi:hypothetical protein
VVAHDTPGCREEFQGAGNSFVPVAKAIESKWGCAAKFGTPAQVSQSPFCQNDPMLMSCSSIN